MKKNNILKSNQEFNEIILNKVYRKNKYFVIYYRKNELQKARFGISVGKKIGKAVIRNKLKRQIRNIIDSEKKYYSNAKDYIIMVRKTCLLVTFEEMKQNLIQLLEIIDKGEKNEKK